MPQTGLRDTPDRSRECPLDRTRGFPIRQDLGYPRQDQGYTPPPELYDRFVNRGTPPPSGAEPGVPPDMTRTDVRPRRYASNVQEGKLSCFGLNVIFAPVTNTKR